MFFTIIIYLLANDLYNRGVKWDVISFIRFLKVIVYEDYLYIYIYKVKWNVKKGILTFFNFIFYVISIITREHLHLVVNGNMVFMISVWLVLSSNVLLWMCLIIVYWFYYTV